MRREGWPKDRPDYLYFRLYKENCDTGEAVSSIARCVGRSAKQFSFAGTKDRRAVTVQQVCAHRLPIDQLRRSVLHRLWDKRVRISNLEYRRERLRLGQLRFRPTDAELRVAASASSNCARGGNRFKVVLRKVPLHNLEAFNPASRLHCGELFQMLRCGRREDVSHDSSTGGSARAAQATSGIGEDKSKSIVSWKPMILDPGHVGAAIIAGEWQKARLMKLHEAVLHVAERAPYLIAVRLILGADECCSAEASTAQKRPSEEQETKELATQGQQCEVLEAQRLFLVSGLARLTLRAGAALLSPSQNHTGQHLERCLLGALARDLSYAIATAAADTLDSLVVFSGVSRFANSDDNLVLVDLPKFGKVLHLVETAAISFRDLVMADHSGKALHDLPGTVDANEEHLFDEAGEQDDLSEDDHETQSLPSVRALSGEDVSSAKLTDIMLPLPGSDVVYPEYLQQVYEEMSVSLLGLPLADFASCKLVPLKGSYRNAVVCPESLEWHSIAPELLSTSALVDSDVAQLLRDRPLNAELKEGGSAASASNSGSGAPTDPELSKCKDLQEAGTGAVMFSCVLPPSSYLTMLLREVMKQITPPPGG
ncbi:PUS7 [Symbiodinium natans]|uniref:PUS7 protein n=1 Tax=Symbiodinium natans TaxID=878477 RepID=A0A812UJQ5_9DINO|nr:PUS7 [Symbiodinium natans]